MTRIPFTSYQRKLLILLSVATFFEGYDFFALSQILPNLRADWNLSETEGGLLVAIAGAGTMCAFMVVRLADRWGRRPIMMLAILAYALFTGLSGLSRGFWDFALFQFLARIFLVSEGALATVYAAEEFPAERRGAAIGTLYAMGALGGIVCAAVTPMLLNTAYGWRSIYFVGVVPILLIAYARKGLKETGRFLSSSGKARTPDQGFTRIWRTQYRGRIVQVAVIWGLTYMCTQCAVSFWKEFATAERGLSDADVGKALATAAVVSLPMLFGIGKALDAWGRRASAIIIYAFLTASVVGAYQLEGFWLLTVALTGAIFGSGAVLAVLNSFTTELFPTDLRSDAFAWCNNLLGRIGYVLAPAIVGWFARDSGWSTPVSLTAIPAALACLLILLWLPETAQRELEQTSDLRQPKAGRLGNLPTITGDSSGGKMAR